MITFHKSFQSSPTIASGNMAWYSGKADPNISWPYSILYVQYTVYTMLPNTIPSIPGPIPSLPWLRKAAVPESWIILQTGGDTWKYSFNFQPGSFVKFPGNRKSPSDYRRDQRKRTLPGRRLPTPGNYGAVSVAPGVPIGAQTGHPASSSPPYNRSVPWSKHLFAPYKYTSVGRSW